MPVLLQYHWDTIVAYINILNHEFFIYNAIKKFGIVKIFNVLKEVPSIKNSTIVKYYSNVKES